MQVLKDSGPGPEPESPRKGFGGLVAELRRRHVVKAVIAYAAIAFVVLQAFQILQAAFELQDWILRLLVVFSLLGLPLVLALAWVYEITPHGVRNMRVLDQHAGTPAAGGLPRVALLFVTVLVVGASGWWWVRSTVAEEGLGLSGGGFRATGASAESGGISALAVLPFDSYSDQSEGDYFAQGMHEALISQLSQLDFLRVLSRTSAQQYDKTGKSVPQIGADLGVDALVEGSVLRAEGKVRITVQLIEAATDRHLWAADYERDLVDIIALQREVAQAIAQEIRGELQQTTEAVLSAAPAASDPVATDEVMRGRMILASGSSGATFASSVLDSAAAHFQRALSLDPDYAAAYSGLAQVHVIRGLSTGETPAEDEIEAAMESAQRALALAPGDRDVREVMATVEMLTPPAPLEMPAPPAPAPSAAPSVPAAPTRRGGDSLRVTRVTRQGEEPPLMALTESGRQMQIAIAWREARSGETAKEINAARRLTTVGMHDQAIRLLEDVLEKEPRNPEAWDELEQIHRRRGNLDAVVALWRERARGGQGRGSGAPSVDELGKAVARDGLQGYWRWRLDDLEARRGRVSNVELAECYAGLGQRDRALELLQLAADARDPRLRSVRTDPVWDPYRRDERFREIMTELDDVRAPSAGQGRGRPGGPGGQGASESSGNSGQRGNQGSGNQGRRGAPDGRPQGPPPGVDPGV